MAFGYTVMDKVCLEGIALEATIGVYEWERDIKQRLELDVELHTDTRQAGLSDALDDAVDYTQAMKSIQSVVAVSKFQLLEALAEKLAAELLTLNKVQAVTLSLSKRSAVPLANNTRITILRS